MPEKKSESTSASDWELSITWEHPLVKAGFWPEHLLRQAFGYAKTGWCAWKKPRLHLFHEINQHHWVHIDTFMAWAAAPENANDLPATSRKGQRSNPAQRGHNAK